MASIVFTSISRRDALDILDILRQISGASTARKYARLFDGFYERVTLYPRAHPPRRQLGPDIRIGIESPYLIIHRYDKKADEVTILRLLDGRRRITRNFMRLP